MMAQQWWLDYGGGGREELNLIPDVTTPVWRRVELDNLTSIFDTTTSSSSNFSGKRANVYSYYMF